MNVLDADSNPITFYNVFMPDLSDSPPTVVYVPCLAGMFLTADNPPEAKVFAKLHFGGGAYFDIEASPIDLSDFDGTTVAFDVIVRAGDVVGLASVALNVRVTFNP